MITVSKLRRKPGHFQAFTGLSVSEFDALLCEVAPAYQAQQQHRRLCFPPLNVGHPFALALGERLLMGLMYLRLYVGQNLLSYLFDLDQSNISRELQGRLLPVLLEVLPVPLRDAPLRHLAQEKSNGSDANASASPAGGKRKRINTLKELLEAYPEMEEVLLDATEQPVPQPKDKAKRKLCYSGKQHDHTVKTQIVATRKLILHVFGGLPGCISDQTLLGASGVLPQVPVGVSVRLDKGYQGTDKRYPKHKIAQPVKALPNRKVTLLGRAYNYFLSTKRIYVEHHFARLKRYGIMGQLYRGRMQDHEDVFCVVSGLLNFRTTGGFCLA